MRIKAIPVKAKELKPGDLFSVAGPGYWEGTRPMFSVGEKAYIRTEAPTPPDQAEDDVYRIEIEGRDIRRKG